MTPKSSTTARKSNLLITMERTRFLFANMHLVTTQASSQRIYSKVVVRLRIRDARSALEPKMMTSLHRPRMWTAIVTSWLIRISSRITPKEKHVLQIISSLISSMISL